MPKGKPFTFEEQREFVELWQRAEDPAEVARALGVMNEDTISQRAISLRRYGIPLKHFRRPAAHGDGRVNLHSTECEQLRALAISLAPKGDA